MAWGTREGCGPGGVATDIAGFNPSAGVIIGCPGPMWYIGGGVADI